MKRVKLSLGHREAAALLGALIAVNETLLDAIQDEFANWTRAEYEAYWRVKNKLIIAMNAAEILAHE